MKLNKENNFVKMLEKPILKKVITIGVASTLMINMAGCTLVLDDVSKYDNKIHRPTSKATKNSSKKSPGII